ncbi:uncharacterized protein LOC115084652 isoform X2 [Rhinatrema bivittatum]|uniref:uncharacterized protein LOC115084652 isoform X2 n=1 Tax=Rhinatrema bivittatum TaxID=194408 RepID=UPI00112B487E|nr:uncharacterized protein LOC115084652 isoform X2 [Rhinatrema bivittatum]
MNTAPASESGSYPTNHSRPFFYAQPTAQQPFLNPWYLSQVYNPYYLPPAPGFRNGNSYFPYYSVALPEYPGFFVPQPQVHTRMSRRPYFIPHPPSPMFYHATRFRHFGSPGRRTETKETQTDPRQPESQLKTQNPSTDVKGCNTGSRTCCSSTCTENESNLENLDDTLSPVIAGHERDFHSKNGCGSSTYRNMPSRSYSFEKEEVRIEYGNGPPAAIQLWKSYKETIPMYEMANGKEVPENMMHVHSCNGEMFDSHAEGEVLVPSVGHSDEDGHGAPLPLKFSFDAVHEKEMKTSANLNSGTRPEVNKQGKEKQKTKAMPARNHESGTFQSTEVPASNYDTPSAAKQDIGQTQRSSGSNSFQEASSPSEPITLVKSNQKLINGFDQQQNLPSSCQTGICSDEIELDNKANLWFEESLEKYVPSPGWLACFDNMDANYNYDTYLRKKQKRCSLLSSTSDELSSRDEESSVDNLPVPYFVPDYLLKKSMHSFQKSTEGLGKKKIKGSGSLSEDKRVLREQAGVANNLYSKDPNIQNSSGLTVTDGSPKSRKFGLLRGVSQKKLYSVKKKPRKSSFLSELKDSGEFWVLGEENVLDCEEEGEEDEETDEAECVFRDLVPREQLGISAGRFFKQLPQKKMFGKPFKMMSPAQLNWSANEKLKATKKRVYAYQVHRPKEREQCEVLFSEYRGHGKKPTMRLEKTFKEAPELKKTLQKSLGGKPQKKKGLLKPCLKSKITRNDPEDVEVWEIAKSSGYRGRGTKKGGYRRQ